MKIAVIIPTYNEERFIAKTLDSLLSQTFKISKILIVNDNSTDGTLQIAQSYQNQHESISVITHQSSDQNIPGSKVINAFNVGLSNIKITDFDIICKYDADLIFPVNYIELLVSRFRESDTNGMVAGHCSIENNAEWELEKGTNKDHIRGALKAYRTTCFQQIGGLKSSIGWDTIDEMLARYYGWKVVTIPNLLVKHLKPTGASYNAKAKYLQGEAFYKMRYGWWLTFITAAKMAWNKKKIRLFLDYLKGYRLAQKKNLEPLVTEDQGHFIRSYRWNGIKSKIGF
ncbi:glycosyltransferase [Nonlabens ulvanivorans]|uniref:Glycosyltransferase n=1 Tax=Nonlabens ulvanivorans TaxID=906888 RepID=A0A081DG49_NONUL|nr:glycosyltransferase family A protein [Nonlabens ulvanivorans]GAK77895.1 glycosyltransferase [Nonlabens ulvanivorans]GAL01836.1 glycosyltransferase [Nonlabens ulvanivorans]